jgi:hypothetical protein
VVLFRILSIVDLQDVQAAAAEGGDPALGVRDVLPARVTEGRDVLGRRTGSVGPSYQFQLEGVAIAISYAGERIEGVLIRCGDGSVRGFMRHGLAFEAESWLFTDRPRNFELNQLLEAAGDRVHDLAQEADRAHAIDRLAVDDLCDLPQATPGVEAGAEGLLQSFASIEDSNR